MPSIQIKWIMFDLDNTLIDFSIASKKAFYKTFEEHQLACSENTYQVYSKINHHCWEQFEIGNKTALQIRSERFADTFDQLNIHHQDPLDFNAKYLRNVVSYTEAYEGVFELLEKLKQDYILSIITNGLKEAQRPRIHRLDMNKYFDSIIVSDEIGVSKPSIEYFDYAYKTIENPPATEEVLVVGDNLKSDIIGGINYGFKTCWLHHGKENTTDIKADYTIKNIQEFENLLQMN